MEEINSIKGKVYLESIYNVMDFVKTLLCEKYSVNITPILSDPSGALGLMITQYAVTYWKEA